MARFEWKSELRELEYNIHDIYKILHSATQCNFQPFRGELCKAECFFVIIQESRAQYVSYVIFRDQARDRNYIYEYESIPFSSSELERVEEAGRNFCKELGFDLAESDVWVYSAEDRFKWFQEIGVFSSRLLGEFIIRPSSSRMIADGESVLTVCSDQLFTVCGFPPKDGTGFWVRASLGEVIGEVLEHAEKSWLVPIRAGVLHFQLRAPKSKGRSLIQVSSEDQKGHASTVVHFEPGSPYGKIALKISANFLIADNESSVEITSGNIYDACGNLVTDGSAITVTATLGRIDSENHYFQDNQFIVPTELGRVTFRYIAGTKVGLAEVKVVDLHGQAEGKTKILLIPGTPSGNFQVKPDTKRVPADGETLVELEAGPIRDRFGNRVADDQLMIVETSAGTLLLDPDDDQGDHSRKVPTKNGKIILWFRAPTKHGTVYISVRNFDRTAAGSCTLDLYQQA